MRIAAAILAASAWGSANASIYGEVEPTPGTTFGLKDAYRNDFKIGMSFNLDKLLKQDPTMSIMLDNADVLIPETDLIWSSVETSEGEFDFAHVDKYLDYCEKNGIEPIGHNLIWKGIGWMTDDRPPNSSDAELKVLFMSRMENYIQTMLTRYQDRIKRWVVVNEWYDKKAQIRQDWEMIRICGQDGVEASYRWAMEYGNPSLKFYHSENTLTDPVKSRGVLNNLMAMRAKGLKIDGIFMQGHQMATDDIISAFDSSIKAFGQAGFKVVLSELDISVLPDAWTCCRNTSLYDYTKSDQKNLNPFPNGMDQQTAELQRQKWSDMFSMLQDNTRYVTDVHLWSVTDRYSWYNKWPIQGRVDYPTLFDRQGMAKAQYYDVLRLGSTAPPAGTQIPNTFTSTQ